MAKKKTGKKAAPKDRPSGAPSQPPASVAPASQAKSPKSVAPSPASVTPATRESRPPAPSSSIVPAEAPVVVKVPASDPRIEAAAPLRVEPAPPKDPASTAPVVKDIDDEDESNQLRADEAAKKTPSIVPAPTATDRAADKKPSEPPAASAKVDAAKASKTDEKPSDPSEAATKATATSKDEPEETAPVSARGSGSTEDAAPPSKPAEPPASTASPTSKKGDDDAPPSSRAPESRSEDKISGKALLDDRLAPKSTGKKKKGKSKDKSAAREGEAPDSTGGVSAEATEEGHDDFFDAPDEKVRQKHYVAEHFEDEEPRFRPLTADDVVRRDKLRRIVTIVVGTAAAACLLAGVRLSMGTKHADPPPLDKSQVVIAAPPVPKPQIEVEEPKPTPAPEGAAPAPSGSAAPTASGSAAPPASASAAPAASASAAPATSAPGGPVDPAEYKALAKNALKALDSGNNKVAVERSSAVVDADPSDATGYLYWGTALMNMGKLGDAKKVFQTCVEKATKGPKGDCKQFR